MGLSDYLIILLLAAPSVRLLIRYLHLGPEERPGISETAGILLSVAAMAASLYYALSQRIFF